MLPAGKRRSHPRTLVWLRRDSLHPLTARAAWVLAAWSLLLAILFGGYGWLLRHQVSVSVSSLGLGLWLCSAGLFAYLRLREIIAGLDYIGLSLVVFAVLDLASLTRSGVLPRGVFFGEGDGSPDGVEQPAPTAPPEGTPPLPADAIQSPESTTTPAPGPSEIQPE